MNVPETCRDCKHNIVGYEHTRFCDYFDFYLCETLYTDNCMIKEKRLGDKND